MFDDFDTQVQSDEAQFLFPEISASEFYDYWFREMAEELFDD